MDQTGIAECQGTDGRGKSDKIDISQHSGVQTNYDAPRDDIEQQIARIWQDAFGIDEVGINDNFTRLGGHSLLAIRIVAELRRAFQVDLPVKALFDAPTVAELSSYVKKLLIAEIEALTDEEARQLVSKGHLMGGSRRESDLTMKHRQRFLR